MTIPNNPAPGREWTNDATGVTYVWDGDRWYIKADGELYVTQRAFEEDQQRQDDVIDTIQEDLDKLEGLKLERRRYKISTDSASIGEVYVDSLIIGQISLLLFNNFQDANGDSPPEDVYRVGDQITFNNGVSKVTFIITESQEFGTPWRYRVRALSFTGAFEEDEEYIVTFGVSAEALSARVAVGEARQEQLITTVDNALEVQEDLVAKVDALEGNVVDDVWEFENRAASPRPGEFTVLNGINIATSFDEVTSLVLSTESKLGNVYGFDAVSEGDVIRLAESAESAAEFRIRTKGADGTFLVDVIRSSGGPIDGRNYDFIFLSSFDPAGLATIDYVDSQDDRRLLKSGDVMGGDLAFKRGANPTSLVIQPSASVNSANTLIYAANSGTLRFRTSIDQDGTTGRNTHITIGKDPDDGSPVTGIYHVQYPEEDAWAANKLYVDTEIADKIGNTDPDVLDGRYLIKTGDTMEGTFKTEGEIRFELPNGTGGVSRMRLMEANKDPDGNGGNSFQFTSHPSHTGTLSDAKVHINISNTEADGPSTKLRFLADPSQDDNAISLGYANDNYLQLSGGTIDGTLQFQRGTKDTQQFKISPNSNDNWATNIYSFNNGQMRFRTTVGTDEEPYNTHMIFDHNSGSPETKIYNIVEPTQDHMAANKLYVDTAVSSNQIRPPGLHLDFVNSFSVSAGQMAYYEDGGLRMRIHKTSLDLTWNQAGPVADVSYAEGHFFTIYTIGNSGSWNIIRTGTINRIDWHDYDILCYVSSHQTNGTFSTNKTYYVTIAGIF